MNRLLMPIALIFALVNLNAQNWTPPLPPELPWNGASEVLVVPDDHPWVTPSELSGLTTTPSYDETIAWLEKLAAASPNVQLVSLGKSPEQRDIWMAVVTAAGLRTAADLKGNGKPTLLAQAGIHSGEIDGKDAGLMLLRDLTVAGTKTNLLDQVNLLFVPILSVDAHERATEYGRINQRGPKIPGWRTNSRNLNLNRDYAKLDTRELQLMIQALNLWDPDLYLDIHVTDGIDYQYDITFGFTGSYGLSPAIGKWLEDNFSPRITADLQTMGHIPGPLIFGMNNRNPKEGIVGWTPTPRFSNGYGSVRHLATVLVENHSLKPYRQRVLGTYVLIESSLRLLAEKGVELERATLADQSRHIDDVTLIWGKTPGKQPVMDFLGVEWKTYSSRVSGQDEVRWTGKPITIEVPYIPFTVPEVAAKRPKAYWIPPHWTEVIERLELHGIYLERMAEPQEIEVEVAYLEDVEIASEPFEGRTRISARLRPEKVTKTYPAGTIRVPTDQPLGDLAMHLLEPNGPDSFFQWGFFNQVIQRAEYVEAYVMIPLAQRMLDTIPGLRSKFMKLLKNEEFASDPKARLEWFYRQTPYYDERHNLYPVGWER